VWSATLIREARLRAGLTQQELAERSGRERSVIARWEQGATAPSLEALLEVIDACGFELPLELAPRDEAAAERLRENVLLSPERRLEQLLERTEPARPPFDPYALLAALERRRVSYVLIGGFARVLRGAEETTRGIDLAPSLRGTNRKRLALALADLGAKRVDKRPTAVEEGDLSGEVLLRLRSPQGELGVVPEPAGTRGGYDDLRRAATREPIGKGLRPAVASTADLARMLAALGRDVDLPRLHAMRRLAQLEHRLGHELSL
jgi:transcriptional regulator with XRE-family HTH domain